MIVWSVEEDEPVPEQTVTISALPGRPVVYWLGRDGVYQWDGQTERKLSRHVLRPSGWSQAWRIVGWLFLAGALGAAIGGWIVMEGWL